MVNISQRMKMSHFVHSRNLEATHTRRRYKKALSVTPRSDRGLSEVGKETTADAQDVHLALKVRLHPVCSNGVGLLHAIIARVVVMVQVAVPVKDGVDSLFSGSFRHIVVVSDVELVTEVFWAKNGEGDDTSGKKVSDICR